MCVKSWCLQQYSETWPICRRFTRVDGISTKQLCMVSHLRNDYFKVSLSFYTWYQTQFSFLEPSFTMRVSLITNKESDGKLASRTNSQSMCENWDYLFHLYLNLWLSQPFQRAGSRIHPITHLGPRHSRRAMLQLWHFFSPQNVSNRRGMKFNRNQKRVNG